MKRFLLILLLLVIQPISNEQIQQNMELQYQQTQQIEQYQQHEYQTKGPVKSPFRDDCYIVRGKDGIAFTIVYRTIIGDYGVIIIDDSGLGLSGWYSSLYSMYQAANKAIDEYNKALPIGSPICLFLMGIVYLMYVWNKQCRIVRLDSRRLD